MKREIYSIGSSARTADEFLSALRFYSIEALVDIRRFPHSRRFSHFQKDELASILSGSSIAYHYLGDELGGFRKGGYEGYMNTGEFAEGTSRLEEIASGSRAAFMCAERFPWKCHRRFVADALKARGWEVHHIIEPGKIWTPKDPDKDITGSQTPPLFVYGSLCDADLVKELLKKEADFEEAFVENYKTVFSHGFPYPFLVESVGSAVEGKIILNLGQADYAILDDYERISSGLYKRIIAPVKLKDGPVIEANLYIGGKRLRPLS